MEGVRDSLLAELSRYADVLSGHSYTRHTNASNSYFSRASPAAYTRQSFLASQLSMHSPIPAPHFPSSNGSPVEEQEKIKFVRATVEFQKRVVTVMLPLEGAVGAFTALCQSCCSLFNLNSSDEEDYMFLIDPLSKCSALLPRSAPRALYNDASLKKAIQDIEKYTTGCTLALRLSPMRNLQLRDDTAGEALGSPHTAPVASDRSPARPFVPRSTQTPPSGLGPLQSPLPDFSVSRIQPITPTQKHSLSPRANPATTPDTADPSAQLLYHSPAPAPQGIHRASSTGGQWLDRSSDSPAHAYQPSGTREAQEKEANHSSPYRKSVTTERRRLPNLQAQDPSLSQPHEEGHCAATEEDTSLALPDSSPSQSTAEPTASSPNGEEATCWEEETTPHIDERVGPLDPYPHDTPEPLEEYARGAVPAPVLQRPAVMSPESPLSGSLRDRLARLKTLERVYGGNGTDTFTEDVADDSLQDLSFLSPAPPPKDQFNSPTAARIARTSTLAQSLGSPPPSSQRAKKAFEKLQTHYPTLESSTAASTESPADTEAQVATSGAPDAAPVPAPPQSPQESLSPNSRRAKHERTMSLARERLKLLQQRMGWHGASRGDSSAGSAQPTQPTPSSHGHSASPAAIPASPVPPSAAIEAPTVSATDTGTPTSPALRSILSAADSFQLQPSPSSDTKHGDGSISNFAKRQQQLFASESQSPIRRLFNYVKDPVPDTAAAHQSASSPTRASFTRQRLSQTTGEASPTPSSKPPTKRSEDTHQAPSPSLNPLVNHRNSLYPHRPSLTTVSPPLQSQSEAAAAAAAAGSGNGPHSVSQSQQPPSNSTARGSFQQPRRASTLTSASASPALSGTKATTTTTTHASHSIPPTTVNNTADAPLQGGPHLQLHLQPRSTGEKRISVPAASFTVAESSTVPYARFGRASFAPPSSNNTGAPRAAASSHRMSMANALAVGAVSSPSSSSLRAWSESVLLPAVKEDEVLLDDQGQDSDAAGQSSPESASPPLRNTSDAQQPRRSIAAAPAAPAASARLSSSTPPKRLPKPAALKEPPAPLKPAATAPTIAAAPSTQKPAAVPGSSVKSPKPSTPAPPAPPSRRPVPDQEGTQKAQRRGTETSMEKNASSTPPPASLGSIAKTNAPPPPPQQPRTRPNPSSAAPPAPTTSQPRGSAKAPKPGPLTSSQ